MKLLWFNNWHININHKKIYVKIFIIRKLKKVTKTWRLWELYPLCGKLYRGHDGGFWHLGAALIYTLYFILWLILYTLIYTYQRLTAGLLLSCCCLGQKIDYSRGDNAFFFASSYCCLEPKDCVRKRRRGHLLFSADPKPAGRGVPDPNPIQLQTQSDFWFSKKRWFLFMQA